MSVTDHSCAHCLIKVPERRAIYDRIGDKDLVFCCHGCQGIYRLIHSEGLSEFYKRREGTWIPGPPSEINIDVSAFRNYIRESDSYREIEIFIDGIRCASCIWLIERMLKRMNGVSDIKINYATHRARIKWNNEKTSLDEILTKIKNTGYIPKPAIAGGLYDSLREQKRCLLIRFGTAAFFTMQIMMYQVALYAGYFQGMGRGMHLLLQTIALILTTPIVFYAGWPFIKGAIVALRRGYFNMDSLIAIGAGSAYVFSIYQMISGGEVYFDTTAMIITIILLGRYIELGAKVKASGTVASLLTLAPKETRLIHRKDESNNIEIQEVSVSSVKEGDFVQVLPGERIPFDGIVEEGESEVDESMLTGEPMPVYKTPGRKVFCGTINLYGSLILRVTGTGDGTVLAQIIRAVEEAQARSAPIQKLSDRVIGIFTPLILIISTGTFVYWLFSGAGTEASIMNAISVLVVACPCALGIATPLAILIGTQKIAKKGILVKGGDIIEGITRIDTVVFDKTGTITEGRPSLLECIPLGMDQARIMQIAASIERLSEHSLARALLDAYDGMDYLEIREFKAIPGQGIYGKVGDMDVKIGSYTFTHAEIGNEEIKAKIERHRSSGGSVVYMSCNGVTQAVFLISDKIRNDAEDAIKELRKMNKDVHMVTGDDHRTASAVAESVRIGSVMAEVSPVRKGEFIRSLQERGKRVIMVGDGINDAPALTQADIGVSMGRATDIALESADSVLLRNDLRLIPELIRLSLRTYRIIQQNLFWAFGYNILIIPVAVMGMLHPVLSAVCMTLSSLSVVGNSMRLMRS